MLLVAFPWLPSAFADDGAGAAEGAAPAESAAPAGVQPNDAAPSAEPSPPADPAPPAQSSPPADPAPPAESSPPAPADPPPLPADAVALYLEALEAWNRGAAWQARRRAQAALAIDPTLAPARLLEAHASARLGERAEAEKLYSRLIEGPDAATDPAVLAAAIQGRRVIVARRSRDQASVYGATLLALRPTGQGVAPALGYAAGVDIPVRSHFGVGADVGAWDASASGTPVVGGPVVDVVATMHAPLSSSPWALRLKVGPSVWFTNGLITGGEVEPEFGVRSVIGFDNRTWDFGGWYIETGGWFWPDYMQRLPVLAYTWDVRAGVTVWLGQPRP